jgi:hypothetical protein
MADVKTRRTLQRCSLRIAAWALVSTTALGGCSIAKLSGGADPPAPAPPPPVAQAPGADTSFTGRVKSFFGGSSGSTLAAAPVAAGAPPPSAINCPPVDFRQGAATLSVTSTTAENAVLSLRYQGSFVQTARECQLRGGQLTIRVGVEGRIVVGPAGAPSQITVPLRYALVREGDEQKTIWTKLFMVPITIPDGQLNVPFMHVEEEMTVPNPPPAELDSYVVYIGFDPDSSSPAKPKPKSLPAAKPKTAARVR